MPHQHSISDLNEKLRALNINDNNLEQVDIMMTTSIEQNGQHPFATSSDVDELNSFETLNLESTDNDSKLVYHFTRATLLTV